MLVANFILNQEIPENDGWPLGRNVKPPASLHNLGGPTTNPRCSIRKPIVGSGCGLLWVYITERRDLWYLTCGWVLEECVPLKIILAIIIILRRTWIYKCSYVFYWLWWNHCRFSLRCDGSRLSSNQWDVRCKRLIVAVVVHFPKGKMPRQLNQYNSKRTVLQKKVKWRNAARCKCLRCKL